MMPSAWAVRNSRQLGPVRSGAARGGVEAGGGQDLPDRGRRDRMPQLSEFALDPAVAPLRILVRQAQHQPFEGGGCRWSTSVAAVRGVVPLLREQSAVPGKEGAGRDGEDRRPAGAGDQ